VAETPIKQDGANYLVLIGAQWRPEAIWKWGSGNTTSGTKYTGKKKLLYSSGFLQC